MAFVSFSKSNNTTYVYLKAYHQNDYLDNTYYYLYSFGRIDKAKKEMEKMIQHFDILFPEELEEEGFTHDDLKKWHKRVKYKLLEQTTKNVR
ncbi:hypothetical protein [Alkalibacillus silvisoli]|uniref:Uncharacterized protein n=1 Tax=Alkalibacillus silvisoli TaxID=392823 RepID=A0ABP3K5Y7_9BACI